MLSLFLIVNKQFRCSEIRFTGTINETSRMVQRKPIKIKKIDQIRNKDISHFISLKYCKQVNLSVYTDAIINDSGLI